MMCKILNIHEIEFLLAVISTLIVVNSEITPEGQNEDLFKRLFKLRRAEQLEAVKKITKLSEDKQHKMVNSVAKTLFTVIEKSRSILESSGYTPGVSKFPETGAVRDALSLVLENTALIGDIILRMPDVSEKVLQSTSEWLILLAWSLTFVNETHLLDNGTSKLLHLVSQELNLTKRDPDYINPYRKINANYDRTKEAAQTEQAKKKKKKTQIPRGPRLTLPQAGEL